MGDAKPDSRTRARTPRKPPPVWHLVTNHQNMLYMLAAGMVMGPAGFGGKHYRDALALAPGLVLLLRDDAGVPENLLREATSERKHLRPCIATFDLADLSGKVEVMARGGRRRAADFPPKRKTPDTVAMLVRAPLPMAWLRCIHFATAQDQQAFEAAARSVSNVDLADCPLQVSEPLVVPGPDLPWPGQQELTPDRRPALGQALGGVLAMLYHAAAHSALGLAAYRQATGTADARDLALAGSDPLLAGLPGWLHGHEAPVDGDRGKLFWGSLQALVRAQAQDRPARPVDVVVEYLEAQLSTLGTERSGAQLAQLLADMRGCFGLGGGTVTELFERHKGPLSRSLLLLCLRERCAELLEFSHPLLNDADFVAACILFGARETWLALPSAVRPPGFGPAVSMAMARAEYADQAADLHLHTQHRAPMPLSAFFPSAHEPWAAHDHAGALDLARLCGWHDCIQTRIALPAPGAFSQEGSMLLVHGDVQALPELIPERFLRRLRGRSPIPPDIEKAWRGTAQEKHPACA